MEANDLKDKVTLITGASRGIGAATARLLGLNKASIVVNYLRDKARALEVVSEIKKSGGRATEVQADVANRKQVKNMVDKAIEKFGKIDVLINNASFSLKIRPFAEFAWNDYQQDIDIIVKGAFNCCQSVLPDMVDRKSGKIINVISTAVLAPPKDWSSYVTAKSALIGFTKALAVEYGPKGINVNMVSPGMTETDLTSGIPKRVKQWVAMQTPLRKIAKPEDIARVLLFLISDSSNFITGTNLLVCGGHIMI